MQSFQQHFVFLANLTLRRKRSGCYFFGTPAANNQITQLCDCRSVHTISIVSSPFGVLARYGLHQRSNCFSPSRPAAFTRGSPSTDLGAGQHHPFVQESTQDDLTILQDSRRAADTFQPTRPSRFALSSHPSALPRSAFLVSDGAPILSLVFESRTANGLKHVSSLRVHSSPGQSRQRLRLRAHPERRSNRSPTNSTKRMEEDSIDCVAPGGRLWGRRFNRIIARGTERCVFACESECLRTDARVPISRLLTNLLIVFISCSEYSLSTAGKIE